jgi:putative transposase
MPLPQVNLHITWWISSQKDRTDRRRKLKREWKYLYRAADNAGRTVAFLLTARRDRKTAVRLLRKAIGQRGTPAKPTVDKSGANMTAIASYNGDHGADVGEPQAKHLNNVVR